VWYNIYETRNKALNTPHRGASLQKGIAMTERIMEEIVAFYNEELLADEEPMTMAELKVILGIDN